MPAYIIVDIVVHNPEAIERYRQLTPASMAAFNGKFVVRGGPITALEGDWMPERIVVIQFPTVDDAKRWWNSEIYSEAKAIRQSAAKTKMIIVEGV